MDRDKVIMELKAARLFFEMGSNRANDVVGNLGCKCGMGYIDDAIALMKDQEAKERKLIQAIADIQIANAPNDSPMSLDEQLESEYKRGICDGLQIAFEILTEDR